MFLVRSILVRILRDNSFTAQFLVCSRVVVGSSPYLQRNNRRIALIGLYLGFMGLMRKKGKVNDWKKVGEWMEEY